MLAIRLPIKRIIMTLYDHAKNIALIAFFMYCAPYVVKEIHTYYTTLLEQKTSIGIITLTGTITDSSWYTQNLNSFFENHTIKGILLVINPCTIPLGTAYALFNEINQLKKGHHKPIVALIENQCNTESYLIACATDHIIASEMAYIECDVHTFIIENDKKNNAFQNAQQHYIKLVATARKLSLSTQDWAYETVTGHQAYSIKLIDQIGSLHNAITFFKQKSLILGTITWIENHKKTALLDCMSHIFLRDQYTMP